MDSIRRRFLQADEDFILAAGSNDHQLLADFADRWQLLQSDWDSCHQDADPETRRLAHAIAERIEELSSDICALESRRLSLEDDLLNGLEDLLASLTLGEPTVVHSDPPADPHRETTRENATSPAQWLLRNLHNPYPLPHVKFSTCRTECSKSTKDWFSKARQRIGWTRLLRDRFAGCRSLATDAAFRAFVRDDPANPLDEDLKTAFLAMKSHAELVYGEGDTASPSPKRLRSISPTPSLTFSSSSEESDDERHLTPPPNPTPKRPLETVCLDSPTRKRRRTHEHPTSSELQTCAVASGQVGLPSSRPKKRCLSESDSDSPRPKRPRGIDGGRPNAVSDSLTVSGASTWFDFDQSFKIPDPASAYPDISSFDLDFFTPLPLPPCSVSSAPAPSIDVGTLAGDFALFETPELDLLQPGIPGFDSDWTEYLNFEPDFSLFPFSYSSASSSVSTPAADDALLPPCFPQVDPSGLYPLSNIPLRFNEKDIQFPGMAEPAIQEQDSPLPPGEDPGIPSITALLSVH